MSPRTKNLALAGGAVMVVGFVAVNTLVAPAATTPAPAVAEPALPAAASPAAASTPDPGSSSILSSEPAGAASPAASPGAPDALLEGAAPATADRRSYAIGLQDLAGLPPDAAPGARLELWVTWEPPVTREPRLQKLIGDVVIERTIPGPVPEAPVTVLLSVPAARVGDLMYADGYGRLSVVVPG
ncbi:MAG: hypothetical protein M3134_05405 [Actinomycetota bacterium]|nr:hypothetical protein [Actinomycetota bacterium]